MNVAIIIASPYQFLKQSDNYLWGFCILKIGGPWHVDAIAVVLALEDYQNSIAKNLRVRDVAVDIYGVAMIPPPPQGRDFFTRQGREFI